MRKYKIAPDPDEPTDPAADAWTASKTPSTKARRIFVRPSRVDVNHRRSSKNRIEHRAAKSASESGSRDSAKDISFANVVDDDPDDKFDTVLDDDLIGTLLNSMWFRMSILAVIIVNAVFIGLQTDSLLSSQLAAIFSAMDIIFITIFVVELGLKLYHDFIEFWKVGWNVFDFVIVAVSLLSSLSFLNSGRVLRIFRVLRAFRALRSISVLQGLQTVVRAVLGSLPDMANVIMLLVLVMFVYAVFGVGLFAEAYPQMFATTPLAMYSLFICVTQDGWLSLFNQLADRGYYVAAGIYTISFISVGAWICINIIVAVTVSNLQAIYRERKLLREKRMRQLRKRRRDPHRLLNHVSVRNVDHRIWSQQRPIALASFSKLTTKQLTSYFLVSTALQDNIAEFADLKAQLEEVLVTVKELNVITNFMRRDEEDENPLEAQLRNARSAAAAGGGDVLSELITRAKLEDATQQRIQELRKQVQRERRLRLQRQRDEHAAKKARAEEWLRSGSVDAPEDFRSQLSHQLRDWQRESDPAIDTQSRRSSDLRGRSTVEQRMSRVSSIVSRLDFTELRQSPSSPQSEDSDDPALLDDDITTTPTNAVTAKYAVTRSAR